MISRNNYFIFIVFVITSVILRFYSFFPSVINHDESTYLIMGRDILLGKSLYTDVTDTKPAGIFLIYAFFHYIFGYSIFLTRIFVSVMVGFTSFLIYRVSLRLINEKRSAIAAGFIYIFYTSIWSQFGIAPNTELFFNVTTISGLLFILKGSRSGYFVAGLLFGMGFMIKYIVLLDYIFLMLFFFVKDLHSQGWKVKSGLIFKNIISGLAFALPFVITNLYYYLIGNFEAFVQITYELPLKYGKEGETWRYFVMLLDYIARFFFISFLFFYVLLSGNRIFNRWQLQMYIVWIAGILIAIYLPGRSFAHYTIQLMLPFSLVAGMFFHPGFIPDKYSAFVFRKKRSFIFLLALVIIVQVSGISSKILKPDEPRLVSNYLSENMNDDDTVYLSNYKHVIYYLLKKDSPTKYVHPTILTNHNLAFAFGIDGNKEIERIIGTNPTFVVYREENRYVENLIKENYRMVKTFENGKVKIFKRM